MSNIFFEDLLLVMKHICLHCSTDSAHKKSVPIGHLLAWRGNSNQSQSRHNLCVFNPMCASLHSQYTSRHSGSLQEHTVNCCGYPTFSVLQVFLSRMDSWRHLLGTRFPGCCFIIYVSSCYILCYCVQPALCPYTLGFYMIACWCILGCFSHIPLNN